MIGNELVPLAALASRSWMREAKAVSSRSSVCFSTVFSPGSEIFELLMPLAMKDAGNEGSSCGVYCFARLDNTLATAADVSSCGMFVTALGAGGCEGCGE